MKREKTVSCTITEKEYEELSIKVAKRIVMEKRHVTVSTYLRDLVVKDLEEDNTVSTSPDDTDSKQKNKEWGNLSMDDL